MGRAVYHFTHVVKKAVKDAILPCSMFEDMGFSYVGPVDGHDVKQLTRVLTYAKDLGGPVLVHVKTQKGKGYPLAEREPDVFTGLVPLTQRQERTCGEGVPAFRLCSDSPSAS